MKAEFSIGQQFMTRGKFPRLCTVVDILTTYNLAGEAVKLRYVATHEFMGQIVTDRDVPQVSVAMGKLNKIPPQ
jgi:hypothetical protein